MGTIRSTWTFLDDSYPPDERPVLALLCDRGEGEIAEQAMWDTDSQRWLDKAGNDLEKSGVFEVVAWGKLPYAPVGQQDEE